MFGIIFNFGEISVITISQTEVLKEQSVVRIKTELNGFSQEAINTVDVSLTGQPYQAGVAYIILDKIFALNTSSNPSFSFRVLSRHS